VQSFAMIRIRLLVVHALCYKEEKSSCDQEMAPSDFMQISNDPVWARLDMLPLEARNLPSRRVPSKISLLVEDHFIVTTSPFIPPRTLPGHQAYHLISLIVCYVASTLMDLHLLGVCTVSWLVFRHEAGNFCDLSPFVLLHLHRHILSWTTYVSRQWDMRDC